MKVRYAVLLSILSVLPYRPAMADRSAFVSYYIPQYITTNVKTSADQFLPGRYRSGTWGLSGGGFTGYWLFEADCSALITLLQELGSDGDGVVDGGVFDLRYGYPFWGNDDYAIGLGAIIDFHAMHGLPDAGWTGMGLLAFGAFNIEEKLYFLPKIGWVKTGFGADADMSSYTLLECGIGYRLAGKFGIMLQPSLDLRPIKDGSANRFALRLGLGVLN